MQCARGVIANHTNVTEVEPIEEGVFNNEDESYVHSQFVYRTKVENIERMFRVTKKIRPSNDNDIRVSARHEVYIRSNASESSLSNLLSSQIADMIEIEKLMSKQCHMNGLDASMKTIPSWDEK
jgi:hypothetical protein